MVVKPIKTGTRDDCNTIEGRRAVLFAIGAMLLAGADACAPRQADLRAFDPAAMAHLETAMWGDYYEKRYPSLFYHLYQVSRAQFGFAPLHGFRVALAAAGAAKAFQPMRSRIESDAAPPMLVTYYRLLLPAAPAAFDPHEAASLELDWWQARREAIGSCDYGGTVARVAALTYGRSADDAIMQSAIERAEAMAYRDGHGDAMTEADWSSIEMRLLSAYRLLKTSVAAGGGGS
jgi:hypothetical protein